MIGVTSGNFSSRQRCRSDRRSHHFSDRHRRYPYRNGLNRFRRRWHPRAQPDLCAGISDAAGNALPTTGLPFVGQVYTQPSPPLYFSTAGNTNPPGVGGTADDADIYFWNGTTAFSRAIDVTAITNPLPAGANVDGFDRVSATHFYMSFNGAVTIALPGPDLTVAR